MRPGQPFQSGNRRPGTQTGSDWPSAGTLPACLKQPAAIATMHSSQMGERADGRADRLQFRAGRSWHPCGTLGSALSLAMLLSMPISAGQAAPWKDCSFNDRPIPCRDHHAADGSVRIVWQDGPVMRFRLIQPGFPLSILRDSLGGRWQRQVLAQGNAVFVNQANGNRIVVPLR